MEFLKQCELFNQAADYYDRYRPSYPLEIINLLEMKTDLSLNSKILEIGSGTGKATELLAPNGYDILCVELGEDLIKACSEKLKNFSNIKFYKSQFEIADIQENTYDLIFSAQAFHWIPQPIGYIKCAKILKDSGALALIWNMYIVNSNKPDNELLALSNEYDGLCDFLNEKQCEDRINSISADIISSGLFHNPEVFRVYWEQEYSSEEYIGFLKTGNGYLRQSEQIKKEINYKTETLIKSNDGKIKRRFLCVLYLTKKRKL